MMYQKALDQLEKILISSYDVNELRVTFVLAGGSPGKHAWERPANLLVFDILTNMQRSSSNELLSRWIEKLKELKPYVNFDSYFEM